MRFKLFLKVKLGIVKEQTAPSLKKDKREKKMKFLILKNAFENEILWFLTLIIQSGLFMYFVYKMFGFGKREEIRDILTKAKEKKEKFEKNL